MKALNDAWTVYYFYDPEEDMTDLDEDEINIFIEINNKRLNKNSEILMISSGWHKLGSYELRQTINDVRQWTKPIYVSTYKRFIEAVFQEKK